jgi:TP901 family phage tail tape measure protein
MSEAGYLATAKVNIVPSLVGFEAALTAGITGALTRSTAAATAASTAAGLKLGTAMSAGMAASLKGAGAAPVAAAVASQQSAINAAINRGGVLLGAASGQVVAANAKIAASAQTTASASTAMGQGIQRAARGASAAVPSLNRVAHSSGSATAKLLGAASATSKLDSALLGLRSAVGSSAVIGLSALALGAIVVGKAIRALIRDTATFETNLNTFRAVTGATAHEMQQVASAAEALGKDITLPAVSAGDAADAMVQLSKAGLSVQDSIDGARGVLQLATAAAIDNATAVEIAASALNAFGLAGRQASHVADVFANAANLAQGSISDIGNALQQSESVAAQVGISFEDTAGFLTTLAQAGLKGSDAGTSLRTALARLINPSTEAAKLIRELGVELRDLQGNLRVDVFQQFAIATRNMTKAQRDQALATIGGQDALRAFVILGRQSTRQLLDLRASIREEGTAAEVAAARTQGLGGAASALSSTLQTIGINLGAKVSPGLTNFTNGVTNALNSMSSLSGVTSGLNSLLSSVGATLGSLGSVTVVFAKGILGAANAVGALTAAIGGLPILATTASIVLLNRALGSMAVRTIAVSAALLTSKGGLSALPLILRSAAASAAAFLASAAGIPLLIGVMVGGFIFLATRASAAEKALRSLRQTSESLATSLQSLSDARSAARGTERAVASGGIAIDQARLAEAQARVNLESSTAAKGSIERRSLEVALAFAIQNVTFATEDYTKATQDAAEAQDILNARISLAEDAYRAQQSAVERLIETRIREAAIASSGRTPGQARDANAARKLVEDLRNLASEQARSDDIAVQGTARRTNALADLIETAKDVRSIPIDIVFDPNQELPQIAATLSANFEQYGFSSAKAFTDFLLKGVRQGVPLAIDFIKGPFGLNLAASMGSTGLTAGQQWVANFLGVIKVAKDAIANALQKIIEGATARQSKLAGQGLDLQIAGAAPQVLLANLRGQLKAQKDVLTVLESSLPGLSGEAKTKLQSDIEAKKNEIISTMDRIASLEQGLESDAKAAGDRIKQSQDKATQAIIDAFSPNENRINNALIFAAATETLSDDIKLNRQLLDLVNKKIAAFQARIRELIALKNFEGAKALREIVDNLRSQRAQVLTTLRKDKEDQQRAAVQILLESANLDIQIAQSRGNKSGEIKAREAEIQLLIALRNKEKATSIERKRLTAEIEAKKKELRDLKNAAKEANKEGTTAFDLLQQAAETFNQTGGNLINGNQPFTGPTGFTADISQFLIRRKDRVSPAPEKEVQRERTDQTDRLIAAIKDLINALTGRHSVGSKEDRPQSSSPQAIRGWRESRNARERSAARGGSV